MCRCPRCATAFRADQVDRKLAQDLVDRFTAAGTEHVCVGPQVGLCGRRGAVGKLVNHDDHLYVRLRPR